MPLLDFSVRLLGERQLRRLGCGPGREEADEVAAVATGFELRLVGLRLRRSGILRADRRRLRIFERHCLHGPRDDDVIAGIIGEAASFGQNFEKRDLAIGLVDQTDAGRPRQP